MLPDPAVDSRRSLLVVDRFAPEAKKLRSHFDARFDNPREAKADRFVWDFWHVPSQYTLLRTPAYHYFPKALYESFHQRLVWWGRRTLGCHDVSPTWLSCYVNDCRQEFHGDLPHGQWAFVYSLTPWEQRVFQGGETLLLRDEVLDYWTGFTSQRSLEENDLVEAIPPLFNRLVVFDPRRPHGVRRVEGTMDPAKGRLVIHGWFVQPRPFIEGPLKQKDLQARIDELTETISRRLSQGLQLAGLLSLSISITPTGAVRAAKILCDTTRSPSSEERRRIRLLADIVRAIRTLRFPKNRASSHVTLPLVFER